MRVRKRVMNKIWKLDSKIWVQFYWTAPISPRIVFANRPDLDQIVPNESIFLIGLIVVLNGLQSSPFLTELTCWKTVVDQKPSHRGCLGRLRIGWGSSAYTPLAESSRGYTKAPEGGESRGHSVGDHRPRFLIG